MPRRRGCPRRRAPVHRAWVCCQGLEDSVTPSQILEEALEESGADLATPASRSQLGHISRENLYQVFTELMALLPRQVIPATLVHRPMVPLEEGRLVFAGAP